MTVSVYGILSDIICTWIYYNTYNTHGISMCILFNNTPSNYSSRAKGERSNRQLSLH